MGIVELKIAVRNLLGNARRSLLTLLIIIIGLTAVMFIAGYINMVRVGFGETLIGEKYSHFQIYKKGYLDADDQFTMKYTFTPDEVSQIRSILQSREEVNFVLPRINLQGLIGDYQNSKLFRGYGADASYEAFMTYGTLQEGMKLSIDNPDLCVLGTGLAEKLEVSLNDSLLITIPNEGGGMEGANVTVGGIANFGPQELNDTVVLTSLEVAKTLNYTDASQYLLVMLHESEYLEEIYAYFKEEAQKTGLDIETKVWDEMDPFYLSVMRDYTFQLNLLASILLFVILLAVSNTIYMSIIERTAEIGTLRAIGISRLEIVRTILLEGIILGILGAFIGVGMGYFMQYILDVVYIELPPPPSLTEPIRLSIALRIQDVLFYGGLLALCSSLATVFPALKAAHTNIISALRHA